MSPSVGSSGPKNRGNAGKGRTKGIPNKITIELKKALLEALERVGGVSYFVGLAQDEPAIFCQLIGRLIPSEVRAEISTEPQTMYINGTWIQRIEGGGMIAHNPGDPAPEGFQAITD